MKAFCRSMCCNKPRGKDADDGDTWMEPLSKKNRMSKRHITRIPAATDTVDVGEVTTADPKQKAEEVKGTDAGSKNPRLSKLGSAVSWNGLVGEIGNIDEDDDDFFAGETIIPDFGKQSTDSKLAGSITLGNLSLSEFNFDPDDLIDRNGRA